MNGVHHADRTISGCSACDQEDNHPRHIVYAVIAHPVTGDPVDLSISKHIDCCAGDGCGICATDLSFAGELRGLELAEFLSDKTAEHHAALFEQHGIETVAHQREGDV